MRPIRCLIVDDEPLAQRVIENFARDLSFLKIVRKCRNAMEAREALHAEEEPIDLMFLDIEMPKLSGLSFMRSLRHPPLVVFTTAYANHALESYELEAVDYLKKPFSFERFSLALEKVQRRLEPVGSAPPFPTGEPPPSLATPPGASADSRSPRDAAVGAALFVKSEGVTRRVELTDITLIEGMGDYVKVWRGSDALVSHQSLRDWEGRLPPGAFVRIHRSFIVAVPKIDAIAGGEVVVGSRRVPIGRGYRQALSGVIGEF